MPNEIWRPIPGREGQFSASSLGRVRREPSVIRLAAHLGGKAHLPQRLLTQRRTAEGYQGRKAKGYWTCNLWIGGLVVTEYVHRLVAAAFLGPCPDGKEVNHLDGDKSHNTPDNLEYVTRQENATHAARLGLKARGEGHGRARLTADAVREIRAANLTVVGTADTLAQRFGVAPITIGKVHRRETWRHLP